VEIAGNSGLIRIMRADMPLFITKSVWSLMTMTVSNGAVLSLTRTFGALTVGQHVEQNNRLQMTEIKRIGLE